MSHNHTHHHDSIKNIRLAFFLNFSFTIIEFIGGFLTNSVAIMSDALHDLGDSFSLGLARFLEKKSKSKRNAKFSYGYKRLSLLGAFINTIILLVGSIFILSEAIPRILNPEPSNAIGMLGLAIFGILVNGFAIFKTKDGKTLNEKVISLHLMEDVLGWIAVFIVSILIYFTNIEIFDPILSILITLYILYGVLKNLKATTLLFLQASPENLDIEKIENSLKNIENVIGIHDIHIWSLDGEENISTIHLVLDKNIGIQNSEEIKENARKILKNLGINHLTIEIDFGEKNCHNSCDENDKNEEHNHKHL